MDKFKLSINVSTKEIDYIMAGALEGGSNYWIDDFPKIVGKERGDYASEHLAQGGSILIYTRDMDGNVEGQPGWYKLTRKMLIKGIAKYYDTYNHLNFDQMDAGDYDCILQFALFDEIVYA